MVFSILGYMAWVTNQDVSEIVSPGSGLAFIVYPEVVSRYSMRPPRLVILSFCQNPWRPNLGRTLLLDADIPRARIHIR